ncbi:MAG: hypothetical protein ACOYOB_11135 [Myxococcota bacterium]
MRPCPLAILLATLPVAFALGCSDSPTSSSDATTGAADTADATDLGDAVGDATDVTQLTNITVVVQTPPGDDDPFTFAPKGHIAVLVQGPKLTATYKTEPITDKRTWTFQLAPGEKLQGLVEIWTDSNGQPSDVVGRGRTIPFDIADAAPRTLHAYVTRPGRFAPLLDSNGTATTSPGYAASTAAVLPDSNVLVIGGALPVSSFKSAYDANSYGSFSDRILRYDADLRTLTELPLTARLSQPRAFLAGAAGATGRVVIGGGWRMDSGKPVASDRMEFYDAASGTVMTAAESMYPDLEFARAQTSMVRLYDGQDYVLVAGGTDGKTDSCGKDGQTPCAANTWEIWHPDYGLLAIGRLNEPRWNHAAVRVPGTDEGYLMLIGGENGKNVLGNFEVVQFVGSYVSQAGQTECPDFPGRSCPKDFLWEPQTVPLPTARTWASAAFATADGPSYLVHILGGFADLAHSTAVGTLDVFDLATGAYLQADNGFPMQQPRGAPMVAVADLGTYPGQVLVAGGSSNAAIALASAEQVTLYTDPDSQTSTPAMAPVENGLPAPRALGQTVTLSTGHVLVVGGIGGSDGRTPQTSMLVWNPL